MKTLTRLVFATGSLAAIGTLFTLQVPKSYAESAAGTIEGSVVDPTGKAATGARISVTCGKVRKTTSVDGAGGFTVSGLPEGTCTLTSTGAGFGTTTLTIEVAGGSISTVLVQMQPPVPPVAPTTVLE
nr:carboxypeptidase regulatory-like domain-containing protein [Deltaproteobacteria bacterium]